MYHRNEFIAKAKQINGDAGAKLFREKAQQRSVLIDKYFWEKNFFLHRLPIVNAEPAFIISTRQGLPFCFINEKPDYAEFLGKKVAGVLVKPKSGGFVTTEYNTGEQWDAPNGWAPLEWMMIWGLDRCGQKNLASLAAKRWIKLNIHVYKQTGKLMEKYNVTDLNKEAGGGEYGGQDGFGWTNGVLLKLIAFTVIG
jgi:alpha,alpha-trehalase